MLTKPALYLALVGAIAATGTTALTAQQGEAAPVRIALEAYGERSGTSNSLSVDVDASGQDTSAIVVSGGSARDFGFLLLASQRASIPGPLGAVLLVQSPLVLPLGLFDASGRVSIPVDLVQPAPSTAYLQAVSLSVQPLAVRASAGLALRFAKGSTQPALDYKGPPSTAILLARRSAGSATTHQLLHRVYVPSNGFRLELTSQQSSAGITRVYMTLEESSPAATIFETKRQLIDLGTQSEAIIEVWIRRTEKGATGPAPYLRAARIERDF